MKPRDPRYKVLVKAQMKSGAGWTDASILNISSRGMLMRAGAPPVRGTYLEIRRGRVLIVARVVWTSRHWFGVKSQDRLSIGAITSAEGGAPTADSLRVTEPMQTERAESPRADSGRWRGRVIEFGFIAALGVAAATFAGAQVYAILTGSVDPISRALSDGKSVHR